MTPPPRTSPVGLWIAFGLFAMALSRLVVTAAYCMHVDPGSRVPATGDFLGGIALAFGWTRVLALELNGRGQRLVAVIGALSALSLTIAGVTMVSTDTSAPTVLWIEVVATAAALFAASAWSASEAPVTAILGSICLSFLMVVCGMDGDESGGAVLSIGVLPIATWVLAGTAVLGLRLGGPGPGLPGAIVLRR